MGEATGKYVAIMGSDDYLDPGALDLWAAHAERTGCDYLVAPRRHQAGASARDPLARPGRTRHLDPVRDRLDYCTAPLGLVRRASFEALGVRLTPGLPSGEDLELGMALVHHGQVDHDRRLPAYVIGADAQVRVTHETRPARDELAALDRFVRRRWVTELPERERTALARRLWRTNLVSAVATRPRADDWQPADVATVRRVALALDALAPRAVDELARADRLVVDAALDATTDATALARAATGRRGSRRLDRMLTRSPRWVLGRDAPLRRAARLAALSLGGRSAR